MRLTFAVALLTGSLFAQNIIGADREPATDCVQLSGETIRWIVPSSPGGGFDAYSRLLEPFLEKALDARIVLETRPEAGGIVAAMALRDAVPDGKTVGIINAAGLLAQSLTGSSNAPNLVTDLTILGRITGAHYGVFTGRGSGISSIYDLLQPSRSEPVVVAVRDIGSANFLAVPVTASLIGVDYALVTGYVGVAARAMAVIRGEVDISISNFDSSRRFVAAGEFIPLMQMSDSQQVLLPGLPVLSGPQGVARQRARATGRTAGQAESEAAALTRILGLGRVLAAPPDLPESLAACLSSRLSEVLRSAELLEATQIAGLRVEPGDRDVMHNELKTAVRELQQFEPLIRAALEQARQ